MKKLLAVALALAATVAVAASNEGGDLPRRAFLKYWRQVATNEPPRLEVRVEAALGPEDAYHVYATDGALVVAGSNARSCLYAVYAFFERLGCAWFWDGDRLPARRAVDVAAIDFASRARFAYRGLRYFAHRSLHRFQAEHWDLDDWERELDWCSKRRLNLAMLRVGQDDLFARAFPDVVPYPKGYDGVSAKPRSYDDRTLFWDMETRAAIRRGFMDMARARGLLVPVDTGTMSHWYSRTPRAFLDKMKPDFIPQANANYNERSGLVWDIRQEKWLDAYWKLTQAEIDVYAGGAPQLFHTIGLGERVCFSDRAENHAFKLDANRRIIAKLRERYPDTPLLVGSWDFISTWSPEEVRAFVKTLDPRNTLILDYTSDIWDDDNNFQNWDLVGKFPWIFGIFNAYEASNEIRGNYGIIRQRFPKAAEDPMCRGVVLWPENSHADTLMLDYFSTIAWDPSKHRLEEFLPDFCARRYGARDAGRRLALWRRFRPLAEASRWGTQVGNDYRFAPVREYYPDTYFNLHGWFYGDDAAHAPRHAEYYEFQEWTLGRLVPNAADTLETLAKEDFAALDELTRRDLVDIARTTLARMLELQMSRIGRACNAYVFGAPASDVRRELAKTRRLGRAFTRVLASSEDFSLNASLARLRRRHPTNPAFEATLKGNAENDYCRGQVYELARAVYEPAFAAFAAWLERRMEAGDRTRLNGTAAEQERLFAAVREAFYAEPLATWAPDVTEAQKALPGVLREAAETVRHGCRAAAK